MKEQYFGDMKGIKICEHDFFQGNKEFKRFAVKIKGVFYLKSSNWRIEYLLKIVLVIKRELERKRINGKLFQLSHLEATK